MFPQFTNESHDGRPVLVVDGEIDMWSESLFREALESLDAHASSVVIDFCRCSYFDSSALASLFWFYRNRAPKQRVCIAMPNVFGRRILTLTRADTVFQIVDCAHGAPKLTTADAVTSLRRAESHGESSRSA